MKQHVHALIDLQTDPETGKVRGVCRECGEIGEEREPPHEHHRVLQVAWPDGVLLDICSCEMARLFIAPEKRWSPWHASGEFAASTDEMISLCAHRTHPEAQAADGQHAPVANLNKETPP